VDIAPSPRSYPWERSAPAANKSLPLPPPTLAHAYLNHASPPTPPHPICLPDSCRRCQPKPPRRQKQGSHYSPPGPGQQSHFCGRRRAGPQAGSVGCPCGRIDSGDVVANAGRLDDNRRGINPFSNYTVNLHTCNHAERRLWPHSAHLRWSISMSIKSSVSSMRSFSRRNCRWR
jgi:hypothetical protein